MDFNLIVPISADPLNNFARSVNVKKMNWNIDSFSIDLPTQVQYSFDAKGEKNTSRVKSYDVLLVCDNDSIVDPKTGDFVMIDADGKALNTDPQTGLRLEGVGQYDFYVGIAQQGPIDIIGLIKMLVLRADSLKRFDI